MFGNPSSKGYQREASLSLFIKGFIPIASRDLSWIIFYIALSDDCVVMLVMSTSEHGLRRSIDKTVGHFTELDLSVNTKKTKIIIFNSGGPSKFP